MFQNYKINFAESFKEDMRNIVHYVITTFKYDGYKSIFRDKVKKATNTIKNSAKCLGETGFLFEGEMIYMRCIEGYLYFYIVAGQEIIFLRLFKDGQDWQTLIALWLRMNGY